MLKLIALNYTVMLNGYGQWFDIQGGNNFIETSVVLISMMLAYKKYTVFMFFVYLKIECGMITI